jgi:hypothetical protein
MPKRRYSTPASRMCRGLQHSPVAEETSRMLEPIEMRKREVRSCAAGEVTPGYLPATFGAGRRLYTVPSALVAEIQAPAGRPSRIGWATIVTLSPG